MTSDWPATCSTHCCMYANLVLRRSLFCVCGWLHSTRPTPSHAAKFCEDFWFLILARYARQGVCPAHSHPPQKTAAETNSCDETSENRAASLVSRPTSTARGQSRRHPYLVASRIRAQHLARVFVFIANIIVFIKILFVLVKYFKNNPEANIAPTRNFSLISRI